VDPLRASVAESVPDLDRYRLGLRAWLEEHKEGLTTPMAASHEEGFAHGLVVSAAMWAAGWKRAGWPESLGGLGGGPRHRATYYDELCRSGLELPDTDLSIEVIGPAMLHFAPALAERALPSLLAGEEAWAQSFSEPDAGSDLASLRTRGVIEGDRMIVNGQKTWTSHGHLARRLLTLVRTGTPESRHRSLAALLIDTNTPGLTVHPLTFASGVLELSEVFFDAVEVPIEGMIGGPGDGWSVAMFMLQYERSMYAAQRQAWLGLRLRQLRIYLDQVGSDEGTAAALGTAWLHLQIVRTRTIQSVRLLDAGKVVGPDASADKILLARAEQSVFEVARHARGAGFAFDPAADPWRTAWWYGRASSIFGGAGEIQRSIVADRVLQLPKDKAG
jgi:alkylation response protein AidB-like acyl-CoA dehydrogenase